MLLIVTSKKVTIKNGGWLSTEIQHTKSKKLTGTYFEKSAEKKEKNSHWVVFRVALELKKAIYRGHLVPCSANFAWTKNTVHSMNCIVFYKQ